MTEFDKVCRACLVTVGPYYYVLFENVSAYTFWFCTSIQVAENETMPKALCATCYELLTKFSQFKQQCIESHKSLLNLKNVKSETDCKDSFNVSNEEQNLEQLAFKTENHIERNIENDGSIEYEYVEEIPDKISTSDDDQNISEKNCIQQTKEQKIIARNKFHCDICSKTFRLEKQLEQHIIRIHQCTNKWLCKNCNETFRTQHILKQHRANVHPRGSNKETKCGLCGKALKTNRSLKEHVARQICTRPKKNVEKVKLQCDLCNQTFKIKKRLEKHIINIHQNIQSLSCTTCNRTFRTRNILLGHRMFAHSQLSFDDTKCKICGAILKNKHSLRDHLARHRLKELFICDMCGKKFLSRRGLMVHIETHHDEGKVRNYSCDICNKKFLVKAYLQCHIARIHSARQFTCHICNFTYRSKITLIKHLLKHEDKQLLYKCDYCDKSFSTRSYCNEHRRVHSGERPFACLYCPKRFARKIILNGHLKTHTGEKNHKCTVCEQRFVQRGTLVRHMKIHKKVATG